MSEAEGRGGDPPASRDPDPRSGSAAGSADDGERWRSERPLAGLQIVITRAEERGIVLRNDLRDRGAHVLSVPCIRFGPPRDRAPLEQAISRIEDYTWVLLTSSTAVEHFFAAAREQGVPEATWKRFRFGVVGPTTGSQLASMGVRVDRMIVAGTAAALAGALLGTDANGEPTGHAELSPEDRCLFPQAAIGRQDVQQALTAAGIPFDCVIAYETLPEPRHKAQAFLQALQREESVDAIAFASPSSFQNFCIMTEPQGTQAMRQDRIPLFSIGPSTSQAIVDAGLEVAGEAFPHTSKGLLEAIVKHFAPKSLLEDDGPDDDESASSERDGETPPEAGS